MTRERGDIRSVAPLQRPEKTERMWYPLNEVGKNIIRDILIHEAAWQLAAAAAKDGQGYMIDQPINYDLNSASAEHLLTRRFTLRLVLSTDPLTMSGNESPVALQAMAVNDSYFPIDATASAAPSNESDAHSQSLGSMSNTPDELNGDSMGHPGSDFIGHSNDVVGQSATNVPVDMDATFPTAMSNDDVPHQRIFSVLSRTAGKRPRVYEPKTPTDNGPMSRAKERYLHLREHYKLLMLHNVSRPTYFGGHFSSYFYYSVASHEKEANQRELIDASRRLRALGSETDLLLDALHDALGDEFIKRWKCDVLPPRPPPSPLSAEAERTPRPQPSMSDERPSLLAPHRPYNSDGMHSMDDYDPLPPPSMQPPYEDFPPPPFGRRYEVSPRPMRRLDDVERMRTDDMEYVRRGDDLDSLYRDDVDVERVRRQRRAQVEDVDQRTVDMDRRAVNMDRERPSMGGLRSGYEGLRSRVIDDMRTVVDDRIRPRRDMDVGTNYRQLPEMGARRPPSFGLSSRMEMNGRRSSTDMPARMDVDMRREVDARREMDVRRSMDVSRHDVDKVPPMGIHRRRSSVDIDMRGLGIPMDMARINRISIAVVFKSRER
ncbi:hypothetical protein FISHEDRAFT_60476 [Fistulina hepatica ATCC 64428]|uniref:Uncharacterized protein n=1 Tax=Fistulina hepatica ATCC 64428 TaxID=1128425 RepID=A0A0D7A690_9AGAR|nr:hypothetical protein FISHEDRAFT_60476 [Fistulina hepatica ATCC 64428]